MADGGKQPHFHQPISQEDSLWHELYLYWMEIQIGKS